MDAPIARLICLRHAESANVTRRQAQHTQHSQSAGMIYASSAVRSRQTATIIASTFGLEVAVLPGLSEVFLGSKEGATDPATRHGAHWHVQWPADAER